MKESPAIIALKNRKLQARGGVELVKNLLKGHIFQGFSLSFIITSNNNIYNNAIYRILFVLTQGSQHVNNSTSMSTVEMNPWHLFILQLHGVKILVG
jgi:hypothetical protein